MSNDTLPPMPGFEKAQFSSRPHDWTYTQGDVVLHVEGSHREDEVKVAMASSRGGNIHIMDLNREQAVRLAFRIIQSAFNR